MNHYQSKRQKERGIDQPFRSMAIVPYQVLKKDTHSLFEGLVFHGSSIYGEGKAFK